jgi:hypothetical protein
MLMQIGVHVKRDAPVALRLISANPGASAQGSFATAG